MYNIYIYICTHDLQGIYIYIHIDKYSSGADFGIGAGGFEQTMPSSKGESYMRRLMDAHGLSFCKFEANDSDWVHGVCRRRVVVDFGS